MANDIDTVKPSAPEKKLSFEDTLVEYPEIQGVHSEKELFQLRLKFPDIPADTWKYLSVMPQYEEAFSQTVSGKKSAPKKKKSGSIFTQTLLEGAVKLDGTAATYIEEDFRYQHFLNKRTKAWNKYNKNASDLQKADYFSKEITAPTDPLDNICRFSRSKTRLQEDVEEVMEIVDPEAFKKYQEAERMRVYNKPEDDPAYISALLTAKGKTRELYEQSIKDGQPFSEEDLKKRFAIEQLKALSTFAKNNKDKTKGYVKQGDLYLLTALSLQREPTEQDVQKIFDKQAENEMKAQAALPIETKPLFTPKTTQEKSNDKDSLKKKINIKAALQAPLPDISIILPTAPEMKNNKQFREIKGQVIDTWEATTKQHILSAKGQEFLGFTPNSDIETADVVAERTFREKHPYKAAAYDARERRRVYKHATDDPVYNQVWSAATNAALAATDAAIAAWKDQDPSSRGTRPDILAIGLTARVPYMRFLIEHFPEKAALYAKQNIQLQAVYESIQEEKTKQLFARQVRTPQNNKPGIPSSHSPISFSSPSLQMGQEMIEEDVYDEPLTEEDIPRYTPMYIPPAPSQPQSPEDDERHGIPPGDPGGESDGGGDGGAGPSMPQMPRGGGQSPLSRAGNLMRNLGKQPGGAGGLPGVPGLPGMPNIPGVGKNAQMVINVVSKVPPQVWVIIGVVFLILLVFLLIMQLLAGGEEDNLGENQVYPVKITKSAPTEINNGELVTYKINVEYPGKATDIIVTDILPENTEPDLGSITEPYTYDSTTRTIKWSLKELQGVNTDPDAAKAQFPETLYASYGFPPPLNLQQMPTELQGLWNTYMAQPAIRAAQLTNVDVGILGMWPWYEGINYNVFYDNCNDPSYRSGTDIDYNPNTPCPYKNWQVGYGIRPMETLGYVEEALTAMYPGKTAKEIGQAVIDNSTRGGGSAITFPSTTFPDKSISDILAGIDTKVALDAGDQAYKRRPSTADLENRAWISILMKDDAISTYVLAKVFQRLVGPSLATKMEGWGASYKPQKIVDYIYAIYQTGIGGGSSFTPQELTVTLRPLTENTYIYNLARAQVLYAGDNTAAPTTSPNDPENAVPNDENCDFLYTAAIDANPLKKNFGDPDCSAQSDTTGLVDEGKIYRAIQDADPGGNNPETWYTVVIPCMGGLNPNAYKPDNGGQWGMFGMGASVDGPGKPGIGPNGTYDRGDVPWQKQIKNAVAYSKDLDAAEPGRKWKYWEKCGL